MRRLARTLGRRRWGRPTALYLRATGLLGLLGIVLVTAVPDAGALVGLVIYTVWVTGPLSPFFPIALEPVLMILGRLYPPLLLAAVVTAAGLWVEYVSVLLYGTALRHRSMTRITESRTVTTLRSWFGRAPLLTLWVLSWSPLPFWAGRVLAALDDYPLGRYLTAIAAGRLPKFWVFGVLGIHWHVPAEILLGIVVAATLASPIPWLMARR